METSRTACGVGTMASTLRWEGTIPLPQITARFCTLRHSALRVPGLFRTGTQVTEIIGLCLSLGPSNHLAFWRRVCRVCWTGARPTRISEWMIQLVIDG